MQPDINQEVTQGKLLVDHRLTTEPTDDSRGVEPGVNFPEAPVHATQDVLPASVDGLEPGDVVLTFIKEFASEAADRKPWAKHLGAHAVNYTAVPSGIREKIEKQLGKEKEKGRYNPSRPNAQLSKAQAVEQAARKDFGTDGVDFFKRHFTDLDKSFVHNDTEKSGEAPLDILPGEDPEIATKRIKAFYYDPVHGKRRRADLDKEAERMTLR